MQKGRLEYIGGLRVKQGPTCVTVLYLLPSRLVALGIEAEDNTVFLFF